MSIQVSRSHQVVWVRKTEDTIQVDQSLKLRTGRWDVPSEFPHLWPTGPSDSKAPANDGYVTPSILLSAVPPNEATEGAVLQEFKPSSGLEPETPSLP
jgi:hypothetical protein